MNYRLMLLGGTATRAPETDEGAQFDDVDDGLDTGDNDEEDGEDDEFDDPDDGDQDDAGDGDDPPQHQQRQPTRGENRVQRLSREAREAREEAARLRGENEALQRRPATPGQSPAEIAAERDRRLAGMTEAQRLEFLITETNQTTQNQINEIRFASWDSGDKAEFSAQCAGNPALKAIEKEVEQRLTEMRKSGQNAPRETVAKYLLGEKALAKAPRARNAGRRREQEGREQHQARPANGRGDVAPHGQRRTSDREARRKRLENMNI